MIGYTNYPKNSFVEFICAISNPSNEYGQNDQFLFKSKNGCHRKEKKLVTFHGTESDVIWPEIRERLSIFKNRAALRS